MTNGSPWKRCVNLGVARIVERGAGLGRASLVSAMSRAGGAPQCLRRLAKRAHKCAAHSLCIAEAGACCDLVNRVRCVFNEVARNLDAQAFDGARWCDARLGLKPSCKIAWAHPCLLRQTLHGQVFGQPLARPTEERAEFAVRAFDIQQCRELRLAARPLPVDDKLLGGPASNWFTKILRDQCQT